MESESIRDRYYADRPGGRCACDAVIAPCWFCEHLTEREVNAFVLDGYAGLESLWMSDGEVSLDR